MELEGDALDKVADVVCAADDGGVGERCGAADGDGPAVGVVRGRELLAVFLGEDDGGVAVDDGTVDGDALGWVRVSRRRRRRRVWPTCRTNPCTGAYPDLKPIYRSDTDQK